MSKLTEWGDWLSEKFNNIGNRYQDSQQIDDTSSQKPKQESQQPISGESSTGESVTEESTKATGKPEQKDETQEKPKPQLENTNDLLKSIINALDRLVEYKESTQGKILCVWLDTDQLMFNNYATRQYQERVTAALVNERDYGFDGVEFAIGQPDVALHATPISNNGLEYIVIKEKQPAPSVSSKAIIRIFGNSGSLMQEQYLLSTDDMKAKQISAYNIGAGMFPKIPTGYRVNHIAIDDSPNSPQNERNKYVSRMHAHIGYSDKFGFYLQVEPDGTRLLGKRTRIFRNEDKIECDNPQAKIPLQNGDLIELGKAVVLSYEQLNNNTI